MDCASCEEAVELEGADACCVVQSLSKDVGDLVGRLSANVAGRDVGFGKFGFEEGSKEE